MKKGTITGKSSPNRLNLTGQRFGRLVVGISESRMGKTQRKTYYFCKCDCGNELWTASQNLRNGRTQSCGCLGREKSREKSFKHGMSHTSIHNSWMSMIQRCTDKNCKAYPGYGGRGIKVCERWLTFNNFLEDMGLPPQKGLTLDRIDNDKGYEPGNVRWATRREQANNRRSSRIIEYGGERKTVAEWERFLGCRRAALNDRLLKGWTIERALKTPFPSKD